MPQFSVSRTTKTCLTRRCSTLYRLNVPVQRIQFNPLDIRSSRPGVKSCWVVEFCTTADVEKSIQFGLKWALTCWCFIRTMTSLDSKLRPIETTWRLLTPTQCSRRLLITQCAGNFNTKFPTVDVTRNLKAMS
ncbi:hypothetical protein DPMN_018598 [Dreissena polymorpha]|uniref:Uncharacterized protein n=1 Tax=Dreissena polymorpha TaxID=45954 RepID=A0A9D4NGV1_DREPO|nr:hypothetical protein DPMN_018598 [Dreissena polymorpha]